MPKDLEVRGSPPDKPSLLLDMIPSRSIRGTIYKDTLFESGSELERLKMAELRGHLLERLREE